MFSTVEIVIVIIAHYTKISIGYYDKHETATDHESEFSVDINRWCWCDLADERMVIYVGVTPYVI